MTKRESLIKLIDKHLSTLCDKFATLADELWEYIVSHNWRKLENEEDLRKLKKGCKFQTECPSASGWCISQKQDYEKCIPFLISAYKNAKKEIQDKFFTKIYYIPKEKDEIIETEIVGFCKDGDGHSFIVGYAPDKIGFQALPWDEHIYFAREEAQKHLKELKGEEDV